MYHKYKCKSHHYGYMVTIVIVLEFILRAVFPIFKCIFWHSRQKLGPLCDTETNISPFLTPSSHSSLHVVGPVLVFIYHVVYLFYISLYLKVSWNVLDFKMSWKKRCKVLEFESYFWVVTMSSFCWYFIHCYWLF